MKTPEIASSRCVHLFILAVAIIYAASTLLYSVLWMVDAQAKSQTPSVELGFDTDFIKAKSVQSVKSVYRGSPAETAGLLKGDEIFAFNGHPIDDDSYLFTVWNQHQPGDSIDLSVNRPGVKSPLQVIGVFRLRQSATGEGSLEYLAGEVIRLFPLPFVVVGLIVLFLRVEDPVVWLLALICGSFIASPSITNNMAIAPALRPFTMGYKAIFSSMLASLFLLLLRGFSYPRSNRSSYPLAEMDVVNHWDVFCRNRFSDWPDVSSSAVSRHCGKYFIRKDHFYYYDSAVRPGHAFTRDEFCAGA